MLGGGGVRSLGARVRRLCPTPTGLPGGTTWCVPNQAVRTSEIRFRLKEFMGLYSDEGKIQPTYSKLIFTPNINGYSWEIATSSHEVKGIVPSSTSSTIATLLNNLFEI